MNNIFVFPMKTNFYQRVEYLNGKLIQNMSKLIVVKFRQKVTKINETQGVCLRHSGRYVTNGIKDKGNKE